MLCLLWGGVAKGTSCHLNTQEDNDISVLFPVNHAP